jgi:hypothetical protein
MKMKIDHGKLDVLLEKILDAHHSGAASRSVAISAIVHVIAAVEKGNEAEVQSWLNNKDIFDRFIL